MSVRDDWRFDWRTRYAQQREPDRMRSERGLPFLRPEDRDDHRRQLDESTGFPASRGLAYLALAGAAGYMGLRHFSSGTLQRAQRAMGRALEKATGGRGAESLLDKVRRALGRQTQVEAQAAKGLANKYLQQDVETAIQVFSAESGIIGNREAVVSGLLRRYQSKHPLHVPLGETPEQIQNLVNLRGFQATASRMGIRSADIARQLSAAAAEPTHFSLGEAMRWVTKARIPILGWRPLELLAPTELLTKGPGLAWLGKENLPSLTDKTVSGLFAGGSLYAIEEHMVGRQSYRRIMEQALGEGYRVGLSRSGMGKGAMARMGVSINRPLVDILGAQPELGRPLAAGEGLWDIIAGRTGTETVLDRLRRISLETGERYGIGPQFAERKGLIPGAVEAIRAAATHRGIGINKLRSQAFGTTPASEWFWSKMARVGLASTSAAKTVQDLPWWERLQLRLGREPHRLIPKLVGEKTTFEKEAIASFLDRQGKNLKRTIPLTERTFKSKYYAYKGIKQGLGDWFNYQLNRPTWLLNEMLGIGLKPGKNAMESLWNIGTRLVLPGYMGWQALQYAEYKSRKYFGYGPISGPAAVYTQGRAAAQDVLDAAGITDKAAELEERFPGALESPFSKATALVGGTFGGAAAGRYLGGPKGALVGTLLGSAAGFTFMTGLGTPADELREIYKGEREVPVRADRWWFLGRQPYQGGRIKYWKKHWFSEMMSSYRDKAIYGSEKEAWRGSWLPTPENWFLLKNIYDPYYVENRHYYDRPYPMTSPMFGEVPLVGPALAATAGRLMKPVQYRHMTVPDSEGIPSEAFRGQQEATAMGMSAYPFVQHPSITSLRLDQMTLDTTHKLFDWTGLPGFMARAGMGMDDWQREQGVLAASGTMTSSERAYYEKNAGGLLGGTEFLRRFLPRSRQRNWINPIENVAPEWLPGHRSTFPGDREGYLNFHRGDPYTLLEKGEARLPGAGYEALHDLHSEEPGVYDDFDRFKVLADVAPFSEAFKHYKRQVQHEVESGLLSEQDTRRYYQTIDNLDERTRSRVATGGRRFGTGAFDTAKVRLSRVLDPTTFEVAEMPGVTFKLAGVSDRAHTMADSQFDAYQELGREMRGLVGEDIEMTWGGPGVRTPAIINRVNRAAMQAGLESDRLEGLGYRAKYGGGGLPALYEGAMHATLPGPLNYPRVKWLGQRSPTEEYEFFYKHGGQSTNWAKPFGNYIIPWWHSFWGSEAGQATKARNITEYVDNLKYVKNVKLMNQAAAAGNVELAQSYSRRASQTLVALRATSPNFWRDIYAALPPVERPYFNVFAGVTGEEEQERILESVPEYMRHIYSGLWARKKPGHQFDSPVLQSYARAAQRFSEVPPDERVAEFFASHPSPPKDWMGWHPGVDLESVTIKTAHQEGLDIHQLGMWESQMVEAAAYEDLQPVQLAGGNQWDTRDNIMSELDSLGYETVNSSIGRSDEEEETRLRLLRRRAEMYRAMQARFSTAQYAGGRFV
jgi:hypothetical protein